jgi:hypothetical protein
LKCDCGWNVLIGGQDKKKLKRLKDFVAGKPMKVEFYKGQETKFKNFKGR